MSAQATSTYVVRKVQGEVQPRAPARFIPGVGMRPHAVRPCLLAPERKTYDEESPGIHTGCPLPIEGSSWG
jgi:hypothetical protein